MQNRVFVINGLPLSPYLVYEGETRTRLNSGVLLASTIRLGLPALAKIRLECKSLEISLHIQREISSSVACTNAIKVFTSTFQFGNNKLECLSSANCAVTYCAMF
jgi:hypothetical protein